MGGASLREKLPNPNINRFGESAGVAYFGFGTPGKEVYKVHKVNKVCNMTGGCLVEVTWFRLGGISNLGSSVRSPQVIERRV